MITEHVAIEVAHIQEKSVLEKAFAIRTLVFVVEQNCPPELEWENEDISTHFIAHIAGKPVGTARWRRTKNGFKLERFAVLKEYRGRGVAMALIKTLLKSLPSDAEYIYLHAQLSAVGLYEKAGFVKEGDLFEEAGIKHYKMVLKSI